LPSAGRLEPCREWEPKGKGEKREKGRGGKLFSFKKLQGPFLWGKRMVRKEDGKGAQENYP
jgi:hypothetical protein